MLRVKRGDRAAFAELVEKYKQPVMNFVYRSLRDEAEAEDWRKMFSCKSTNPAPATNAPRNSPRGSSPSRATFA
jgi:hypothetical protein